MEENRQIMPRFSFAINDLAQQYKIASTLPKSKSSTSINKSPTTATNLSYSMLVQKMTRRKSLKTLCKNVECKCVYESKRKSLSRKKERFPPNPFKLNQFLEPKTFFRHESPNARKSKAKLVINTETTIAKNSIINKWQLAKGGIFKYNARPSHLDYPVRTPIAR